MAKSTHYLKSIVSPVRCTQSLLSVHTGGTFTLFLDNAGWVLEFLNYLESKCAPCKNLGEIGTCLGIEVAWNKDRSQVTLSSKRKIQQMLIKHDLVEIKPRTTPIEPGTKLEVVLAGTPLSPAQKKIYQSITGILLYIMRISRVDLQFGVYGVNHVILQTSLMPHCRTPSWKALHRLRF